MKNRFTFFICFFIGLSISFAQLTVTGGTSVFVTDEIFYVNDKVELSSETDNITLREEAQLIQGNSGGTTNTGLGYISVFQEGVANAYHYNYWSSPVGSTINTTVNNPFKIELLRDGDATSVNFGELVNFTTDAEGTWSPLTLSTQWLYTFGGTSWDSVLETGDINSGNGFTLKGTDNSGINNGVSTTVQGQRYEFRGKPNNGDISITTIEDNFYLLGNPYPSALDADQFILDNTSIIKDNTLYFWDQWGANSHFPEDYSGNYATYISNGLGLGTAVAATIPLNGAITNSDSQVPARYIPIAQGFFIEAEVAGTLSFRNLQRPKDISGTTSFHDTYKESAGGTGNGSKFFKILTKNKITTNSERKSYYLGDNFTFPTLAFNVEVNNQFNRTLLLVLRSDATEKVEQGLDAEMYIDLSSDAFWTINNKRYNIQSDAYSDDKEIPLGLVLDNDGEFKISISANEYNAPEDVYLYDEFLNTEYLLNSEKTISLPKGEYTDRFKIRFESSSTLTSTDLINLNSLNVFYHNSSKELIIENPETLNLQEISVFDVVGKKVFNSNNLELKETYAFSLENLSNGFYIVKTKTKKGFISTKRILVDK